MRQLFLDCDGVLADFDSYATDYFGMNPRVYEEKVGSKQFWQELEAKGNFYRDLPLMHDARGLVDAVAHLRPTILTGSPRGDWARQQKMDWAREHFPELDIIVCRSADKWKYSEPGDVIIDDWNQYRHCWIAAGGIWITHTCAKTSLDALWAHCPELEKHDGRE